MSLTQHIDQVRATRSDLVGRFRALEQAVPHSLPASQHGSALSFLRLQAARIEASTDAEVRKWSRHYSALAETVLHTGLCIGGRA